MIPCSAETVTIELIGNGSSGLEPSVVREAAAAVVYYFKNELGRDFVSVGEFAQALEKVLGDFGYDVESQTEPAAAISDLEKLARESGKGFELIFFVNLRAELKAKLKHAPPLLTFNGLKACVKTLVGAKRWCERCDALSDQIVEYLRHCLSVEPNGAACGLVVR